MNEISIEDIKKHTKNDNVSYLVADLFWDALEKLSNEDRALFLWNWTGVDKMPAEGAKIMDFSIISTDGKFIVAHTWYKELEIPSYWTI